MKNFDNIKFLGTFRNYQQRVLDNSKKYLKNNKIHIVAAPGSGKTILGLELIRRLNAPCLVLSPTNTIRYQWGDRFESMFLEDKSKTSDYVSFDLNDVKLITSTTYQALHSAIDKIGFTDEDGNDFDYSKIDMFKLINDFGIKTICVDEAHHLQNEWQKALDIFIKGLDKNIKIIALTATPPYDATESEWNRYINICGDIDEEIYVTELVKAKNLCPHQDYIYLNYPTHEESIIFKKFKENVILAFNDIKSLDLWQSIPDKFLRLYKKDETIIFNNIQEYIDIFSLLKKFEIPFKENKIKKIFKISGFTLNLKNYENALNFLLQDKHLVTDEEKDVILKIFKKYGITERNKISIENNSKLEKNLLLSIGKLESIIKITNLEHQNLKNNLRLLILTDYIRKNTLTKVGTNDIFDEISIVSIFENIRRQNKEMKIGILSGTLVVLPTELEKDVKGLLGKQANKLVCKPLNNTDYSEYIFNLSNKEKVSIVGKLFEEGKIVTIVGTKSLLGEGWDSPCINSLIMASFVGSFMLSNQMRGRAIRVFKNDPNKTANIWHLVTLEPESLDSNEKLDCNEESSSDYKTLKRRFDCFVGPHYTEDSIESGIDRISILKDSYTKDCVNTINTQMEELSNNRDNLVNKWNINSSGLMYFESTIQNDRIPRKLGLFYLLCPTLISLLIGIICSFVMPSFFDFSLIKFGFMFISIFSYITFAILLLKSLHLIIPTLFIKAIATTIKKQLEINSFISSDNKFKITKDKKNKTTKISLLSDNIKEQKIFLTAICEFLSPIKDARYIIYKSIFGLTFYKYSYQVPKILAVNKDLAENFRNQLKILSKSKVIYISSQNKKFMYLCQKYNYIKQTSQETKQKQVA